MKHSFKAEIYRTGINWASDVPGEITARMVPLRGRIRIKGKINGFEFTKTLVPVKNGPYRLFVNLLMMKGGKTAVGRIAEFEIEQDHEVITREYPVPEALTSALLLAGLTERFDELTPYRRKDILRYLNQIKTEATLHKNIGDLLRQLKEGDRNARIPRNLKK
jgi:hypothetical protein